LGADRVRGVFDNIGDGPARHRFHTGSSEPVPEHSTGDNALFCLPHYGFKRIKKRKAPCVGVVGTGWNVLKAPSDSRFFALLIGDERHDPMIIRFDQNSCLGGSVWRIRPVEFFCRFSRCRARFSRSRFRPGSDWLRLFCRMYGYDRFRLGVFAVVRLEAANPAWQAVRSSWPFSEAVALAHVLDIAG